MLKKLVLVAATLCLTSCATIFTKKEYKLKVFSYEKDMKAEINDSVYDLPAYVKVRRSKEDLKITLIGDTIRKDFIVKSSPNPAFVYGNLIFMQACPVGYAIDFTTQKRFYYGRKVNLNSYSSDTIEPPIRKNWNEFLFAKYPQEKGDWVFTVSIPYANVFHQKPKGEQAKNSFGFFGLSAGLEYYYKDNKFVKLNASYANDFEIPIPAPLDRFDAYETLNSTNFTLTDNYKTGRFTFGYGLNYAIYTWRVVNPDWEFPSNDEQPRTKNSHSFGLTANAYFQASKNLFFGVVYSPTFYNTFPESNSLYQHYIGFDIMYKLPFKF